MTTTPAIRLFRTVNGIFAESESRLHPVERDWDDLVNDDVLFDHLLTHCASTPPLPSTSRVLDTVLAPIDRQEVWACGVTYFRSREARVAESRDAGGGDFYERVYDADRPELFFKATAQRVVGHGAPMHLRRDSRWIVPEPELTLAVTRNARIIGYTVGNDLSCRDIEGENPLYLPQAKTFERCAALGPGLLVTPEPLAPATAIHLTIRRADGVVADETTTLAQMKRSPSELVEWLFRDNAHPAGCLLMTGTGIVPPDELSLEAGDVVDIAIDGIGTLSNPMD